MFLISWSNLANWPSQKDKKFGHFSNLSMKEEQNIPIKNISKIFFQKNPWVIKQCVLASTEPHFPIFSCHDIMLSKLPRSEWLPMDVAYFTLLCKNYKQYILCFMRSLKIIIQNQAHFIKISHGENITTYVFFFYPQLVGQPHWNLNFSLPIFLLILADMSRCSECLCYLLSIPDNFCK